MALNPVPASLIVAAGLAGLVLGRAAGELGLRLAYEKTLARPWLRLCLRCGEPAALFRSVPLLGSVLGHGRCAACGERQSGKVLWAELATGVWFAAVLAVFGPSWGGLLLMLLGLLWITAGITDLEVMILPDVLTLPAVPLALAAACVLPGRELFSATLAGLVSAGFLWFARWAYMKVRKTEGLGLGDVKLMLSLGAAVRPLDLPLVFMAAGVAGMLLALPGLAPGKADKLGHTFPFGPALILGAMAVLLWRG